MNVFAAMERLMSMDERIWARHANPWSVWTRFSVLPLLALTVWSRVWLGWGALLAVALVLVWVWANPRVFAVPRSTDNWASKVVLGEQVFLTRRSDVADHHMVATRLLAFVTVPGALVMIWGLWALWWDWAMFGTVLTMGSKAWFCDRMVWIYEDMTSTGEI